MNNLTELELTLDCAIEAGKSLMKELELTQESIIVGIKVLQDAKEENDRIIKRYEDFLNEHGTRAV